MIRRARLCCATAFLGCLLGCSSTQGFVKNQVGLPHSLVKRSSPLRADLSELWRLHVRQQPIPKALLEAIAQGIRADLPDAASEEDVLRHIARNYAQRPRKGGVMLRMYFVPAVQHHDAFDLLGKRQLEVTYVMNSGAMQETDVSSGTLLRVSLRDAHAKRGPSIAILPGW